ncbi:MAG: RNB domain-containing ribonuclease [Methanomicrobiales archaeon]|nr:RNB domain-containing ribonuclease [Methanomicrobiales archaeon]MDD1679046.1 RNB domain-containing ribonuclease [Methanomicrobiales archaeon]
MKNSCTIDLHAIARYAMERYHFYPAFPESVIREVGTLPENMPLQEGGNVRDLRSVLWSSIDNADSLDLDQLEYCELGPSEEIQVKIAIADVDLYVYKGSHTDRHAAHNGTSVYTGIQTFPLFPDRLSKNISSLLPGMDRIAIVIEYTVLPNGYVRCGNIYQALVSNKAQLIYEEVGDWLEGTAEIPRTVKDVPGLEKQLRLQIVASQRLKTYRASQGALELDTIEAQAIVEEGKVRDLVVQRKNLERYLIEDFMISANSCMVSTLKNAGISMIQRVVRTPKNWERIVETAAMYGEILPSVPNAKALSKFLERRKIADPERFPDLSLTIVKLLGPGEYMTLEPGKSPYGHFSLAVIDYTHSTAPNRRYVDVINQRLLKSILRGEQNPYTVEELTEASAWLTDRDKSAQKVERFTRKAAAAVLLKDRVGEVFDALVTGASEKGTYVRLLKPPAEGRVMKGEQGLLVGQKVRVRLIRTDPCNGYIDFVSIG